MELHYPSIPILLTFFFIFLFMVAKKAFKSRNPGPKLPPGPWKLPLVGNIHQLSYLVHRTLRDLARKYGPLMHLQLGEVSTVIVSSPEMAREIMKTHDIIFASRPYLLAADIILYNSTDIGFCPYGDYWKRVRKICTMEILSHQHIQTFRGIREDEVMNLIISISSDARGAPINLTRKIFSLTYGIIARAAFGNKCKHQEKFISIVQEISASVGGFSITDVYPSLKFLPLITGVRNRLEKAHKRLDEVLQNILDEFKEKEGEGKREENAEVFVDALLRIQKHGGIQFQLTDENIKAIIYDMFSGGGETSSTTVEWAISELVKNPEIMERTQAEVRDVFGEKGNVDESGLHELKYLKLVIKETLRLHPPLPLLLPRECSKDCEINGYVIPAKTRIIVNVWATGRDPRHWDQPENFNPDRFLNSGINFKGSSFNFIPFGAGRRMCPGIAFAIPNIELPLAQLLYHFDWRIPGSSQEDFDMTEAFGASVRRKNNLCLIPIPYQYSKVK